MNSIAPMLPMINLFKHKSCLSDKKMQHNRSRLLFAVLLIVTLFGSRGYVNGQGNADKIIVRRIEYFYRLKTLLDKRIWTGFDDSAHELPLVYYTDRYCYVANPTARFLGIHIPRLVHKTGKIRIYQTKLLDSTPFHMETFMNFTDTAAYNYHSLFMACSSYEITAQHPQAEVRDLERWATLVLHGYFHGFQFTYPAYAAYHRDSILPVLAVTLRNIYDENAWIKQSIDAENDLLLRAIEAANRKQSAILVDSFFTLRTKRRDMIERSSGFKLTKYESFYETMEGTARYIEYGLINACKQMPPDQVLAKTDTTYHGYAYFRSYDLEKEPSMFLTNKTNYVYAVGFNMARLLDKLGLPYKHILFSDPQITLETILLSFVKNEKWE
jgi:hypothetical protein